MTRLIRLRGTIELESPEGKSFSAKWRGSDVDTPKKVGVFTYNGVNGATTQDGGLGAEIYPMTLYFEGFNNDLEAKRFTDTMREKGVWKVTHPTDGNIDLQPVSVLRLDRPTESILYTAVETEWIKPIEQGFDLDLGLLFSAIGALGFIALGVAVTQFVQTAQQDTSGQKENTKSTTNQATGLISKEVNKTGSEGTPEANAILARIQAILGVDPLDTEALAEAINELVNLNSSENEATSYSSLNDSIATLSPETPSPDNLPIAAVQELCFASSMVAITNSLITRINNQEIFSRSQAIEAAEFIFAEFEKVIAFSDQVQELYQDQRIDRQYFSQSETYSNLLELVSETARYLITASFDLKTEKIITLKEESNVVVVCVEQYGTLDELDFLIDSNELKENEILILESGRQLKIYV